MFLSVFHFSTFNSSLSIFHSVFQFLYSSILFHSSLRLFSLYLPSLSLSLSLFLSLYCVVLFFSLSFFTYLSFLYLILYLSFFVSIQFRLYFCFCSFVYSTPNLFLFGAIFSLKLFLSKILSISSSVYNCLPIYTVFAPKTFPTVSAKSFASPLPVKLNLSQSHLLSVCHSTFLYVSVSVKQRTVPITFSQMN